MLLELSLKRIERYETTIELTIENGVKSMSNDGKNVGNFNCRKQCTAIPWFPII
jgi:hypothetical protein